MSRKYQCCLRRNLLPTLSRSNVSGEIQCLGHQSRWYFRFGAGVGAGWGLVHCPGPDDFISFSFIFAKTNLQIHYTLNLTHVPLNSSYCCHTCNCRFVDSIHVFYVGMFMKYLHTIFHMFWCLTKCDNGTNQHAHASTRARAHTHTRTHALAHTHIRARAHTHTHTHTENMMLTEAYFACWNCKTTILAILSIFLVPGFVSFILRSHTLGYIHQVCNSSLCILRRAWLSAVKLRNESSLLTLLRCRDRAALVPNLDIRTRRAVSCTVQPLHQRRNSPRDPLHRVWVVPRAGFHVSEKTKPFSPGVFQGKIPLVRCLSCVNSSLPSVVVVTMVTSFKHVCCSN